MRCKSMKDGEEGWITIKGNKGTVYAEETTKLYTLVNAVAFHKQFETDGATLVRQLVVGEAVEVIDGPKEEKREVTRLKGRAVSDGAVGWVSLRPSAMKPWSPQYKCSAEAVLSSSCKEGGDSVRNVEVGEIVQVLDGPKKADTSMRMKVRAEKDSAAGWVTLRTADGTDLFKNFTKSAEKSK